MMTPHVSTGLVTTPGWRLILSASIVFAACVVSATARADVNDLGYYIGGRLLPAIAVVDDESQTGGSGNPFGQDGDGYDSTIGAGLQVGYHWNEHGLPIRTEIEYAYRYRYDFDSTENNLPQQPVGYKDDVSTHSLMLSLYLDFATDSPWRPYVGAGVGWARNSSTTLRDANDNTVATQEIDNDVDNLAYSLSIGSRVAISDDWVADVGYRFIDFGEVATGKFSGGDEVSADSYVAHEIVLGINYLY